MKKRTIKEWFELCLEGDTKKSAINYSRLFGTLEMITRNPYDALKAAFPWSATQENEDDPRFWSNIANELKNYKVDE